MLAAQLVATHNAAMECYRRAMLDNQTFEGRRENLGSDPVLRDAAGSAEPEPGKGTTEGHG